MHTVVCLKDKNEKQRNVSRATPQPNRFPKITRPPCLQQLHAKLVGCGVYHSYGSLRTAAFVFFLMGCCLWKHISLFFTHSVRFPSPWQNRGSRTLGGFRASRGSYMILSWILEHSRWSLSKSLICSAPTGRSAWMGPCGRSQNEVNHG